MKRARNIVFCAVLLVGGLHASDETARKIVQRRDPEYPTIAAQMNLHGTVKLRIWISPDGTVRRVEYVGGHPLLAESALEAVKHWRYAPAAKESTQIVEVKF